MAIMFAVSISFLERQRRVFVQFVVSFSCLSGNDTMRSKKTEIETF